MTMPTLRDGTSQASIDEVLVRACKALSIDPSSAQLLRHFANAVFLVAGTVIRIGYGPSATAKANNGLAVAKWLVQNGFPATPPALGHGADEEPLVMVHNDTEYAITLWRYLPQPDPAPARDFAEMGRLARALHNLKLQDSRLILPEYSILTSLEKRLKNTSDKTLTRSQHSFLTDRLDQVRATMAELKFPLGVGLIHGDFYAGNMLFDVTNIDSPWVVGDWDGVALGPRELDVVPTATAQRFGLAKRDVDTFMRAYGYDVRDWIGYPTLREARELGTLSALIHHAKSNDRSRRELAKRLRSLMLGDVTTHWTRQ